MCLNINFISIKDLQRLGRGGKINTYVQLVVKCMDEFDNLQNNIVWL